VAAGVDRPTGRNRARRAPGRSTIALLGVVVAAGCAAGCPREPAPTISTAPTASAGPTSSTGPTASAAPSLDCSDPIGSMASPPAGYRSALDAVALDTTALQAGDGSSTDPHRLFVKTGLLVHAGHESTLTVPAAWSPRLAIAWGNHAAEWTTSLHIPACPSSAGAWLAFPGGFSLDRAACVPLEVHTASGTATVEVSAGVRCRG
jgi:hypothetical protein